MKNSFHDLETRSPEPIRSGAWKYAEQAEILLWAYALEDQPAKVWDVASGAPMPCDLAAMLADDEVLIWFHNGGMFDFPVIDTAMPGIGIPAHRRRDTMVLALLHALPASLGELCDVLKVPLDKAKAKEGRDLVRLFCIPPGKHLKRDGWATTTTHPTEWAAFVDYARLDVEAMREVYKRVPKWNLTEHELALWRLDQRVNARGIEVDTDYARAAITLVAGEKKRLAKRVGEVSYGEVEAATQRDALLKHLLDFYGVSLPDMQKGTLERRVNDESLPEPVRELIAIRLDASGTATAKYDRFLCMTNSDGRLRGTLQFCGASRTGRWAGRGAQLHNLPRPRHDRETVLRFVDAVKAGCADVLFDDLIPHATSAVRGLLVAPAGKKLVVADLANIEGRMLAWLAGEEWKLQAFRDFDEGNGSDLYKLAYARAFNVTPEDVDGDQRQLGKIMELALGYGGAVGAFQSMAQLFGMDMAEDEVLNLVRAWRASNPNIVKFWYALEDAATRCVTSPGVTIEVGRVRIRRDGAWLKMTLPSGRALVYPQPRMDHFKGPCRECEGAGEIVTESENAAPCPKCRGTGYAPARLQIAFSGVSPYTRKWGKTWTYSGKLAENLCQAASRDVLADAMLRADISGYSVVTTVHDELVTEVPDSDAFTAEGLSEIMATNPAWADGLPLAAAGFEATRYGKE